MNDYPTTHGSVTALRPAVGESRLRLTRRGRVVFTALAAIPLVIAAFTFALNGGMATATVTHGAESQGEQSQGEQSQGAQSSTPATLTVYAGESLWGMAQELAPTEDTREVVAQILKTNSLANAEVRPGQQLVVPALYR